MRGPAVASALIAVLQGTVHGDGFATSPVRAGYQAAQQRLLDGERRDAWEKRGLRWDAAYAAEIFVAPQLDAPLAGAGLLVGEAELDLATHVADGLGAAHIAAFAIHGSGLTAELADIHGVSGNDAADDVRLFEAWYEQPISAFTLRAGLLAADQEFVLADHSTTLLGATFGITSQFSANVLGPVYPVATPGASGRLELDAVVVRAAVYDGTQTNRHGIPTDLGPERLAIGELELAGMLQVGAWHHSEHGYAYYAVIDALVAPELGGFARVGISPDQRVETYIDAGARLAVGPRRPDDFICVGVAFAHTTEGAQTVVEASYEAQIRWLTVQPDIQVVMLSERTVAVLAMRATVVF